MEDFGWAMLWMIILLVVLGSYVCTYTAAYDKVLIRYCESMDAEYKTFNDKDHCFKDNKLTIIEWMKEKK